MNVILATVSQMEVPHMNEARQIEMEAWVIDFLDGKRREKGLTVSEAAFSKAPFASGCFWDLRPFWEIRPLCFAGRA